MSVLFATISKTSIVMCADKLVTNAVTGEVLNEKAIKIARWTPNVAVGSTGSLVLGEVILTTVFGLLDEQDINSAPLDSIADLMAQAYYAAVEEYPDMPKTTRVEIIVAGVRPDGNMGAYLIACQNDVADVESYEAKETPFTLILAPADMTTDSCNQLFQKAVNSTKKQKKFYYDPIETVHRKAVRYVSEHSKFVGSKADCLVITMK